MKLLGSRVNSLALPSTVALKTRHRSLTEAIQPGSRRLLLLDVLLQQDRLTKKMAAVTAPLLVLSPFSFASNETFYENYE